MKNLLKFLDNKISIPYNQQIYDCLDTKFYLEEKNLTKLIEKSDNYSLGLDIWDFNFSSILGVNIKIELNGRTTFKTLGIVEIGDHYSSTVSNSLYSIITKFKISKHNITAICTDNARNMLCSIKYLNSILESDEEEEGNRITDTINSIEQNDGRLVTPDQKENIYTRFNDIMHLGCLSHKTQLVICHLTKAFPEIKKLIEKICLSVKSVNKVESRGFAKIRLPCTTRWNSLYETMDGFSKNLNSILRIFKDNTELGPLERINSKEVKLLLFILPILEQIFLLSKFVEKRNVFFGKVVVEVNIIKSTLSNLLENEVIMNNSEQTDIIRFLIKEFSELLPYRKFKNLISIGEFLVGRTPFINNEQMESIENQITAFLQMDDNSNLQEVTIDDLDAAEDPLFRNFNVEQYGTNAGNNLEISALERKKSKNANKLSQSTEIDEDLLSNDISDAHIVKSAFCKNDLEKDMQSKLKTEIKEFVARWHEEYINEDFWLCNKDRFALLYGCYNKMSSIMVSNGEIERVFSRAKLLTYWKRNRLSVEMLRKRIILHENMGE